LVLSQLDLLVGSVPASRARRAKESGGGSSSTAPHRNKYGAAGLNDRAENPSNLYRMKYSCTFHFDVSGPAVVGNKFGVYRLANL